MIFKIPYFFADCVVVQWPSSSSSSMSWRSASCTTSSSHELHMYCWRNFLLGRLAPCCFCGFLKNLHRLGNMLVCSDKNCEGNKTFMILKLTVENCFKESAPSMEWFTIMPSLEIREKFYTDDEAILHTGWYLDALREKTANQKLHRSLWSCGRVSQSRRLRAICVRVWRVWTSVTLAGLVK